MSTDMGRPYVDRRLMNPVVKDGTTGAVRTEYEERRRVCERVGHEPAEQPRPGKTSIWVCLRCGRSVSPDGKRLAA